MKKRLLSLFLLFFMPSLITGCDTKVGKSNNNFNNSSLLETTIKDNQNIIENENVSKNGSTNAEIEPYGYTIENGKMTIDVKFASLSTESYNKEKPSKLISGNTYDVYELDLLHIYASINVEDITSNNESIKIYKENKTDYKTLAFADVGTTNITISYENESYNFYFNIIEAKTNSISFVATPLTRFFYDKDYENQLAWLSCQTIDIMNVIPGCEYTLTYKGFCISQETYPPTYVFEYHVKIMSFEKSKDASIETFVVSNGKAYKNVGESLIYPFFYTYYLQDAYYDLVEFAIDENGKIFLIEDLPDNTVLYGYVNDGIVYGYYTYDINTKDPIIIDEDFVNKNDIE